jgi:RHS repeat-associated protein
MRGTASMSVPVAIPAGRGLVPEFSLSYDAGAGNSVVGLGWRLAVPSIKRRTEKGVPRYIDDDTFVLAGAEDLVPSLTEDGGVWEPTTLEPDLVDGRPCRLERFLPRIEDAFARIERCRDLESGDVFWRTVSRTNVVSVFGRSAAARIADPRDAGRVFEWLLEETRDDLGNLIVYDYRSEDTTGVEDQNVWERSRLAGRAPVTNTYLKRIRYANREPGSPAGGFCFHVLFDYGDHASSLPTPDDELPWPVRPDPFSSYRSGFEIRTWRSCRRILVFHDFPADDLGPGPVPRLVRSTDLAHDDAAAGVHLVAVTQSTYVWNDTTGAYDGASQPPVEFEYTRSAPDDRVLTLDQASLEQLPTGVDDRLHRWLDLDGEGLPGVLTQQGDAWYYKRNRGGNLAAAELLPEQPAVSRDGVPLRLVELAGDGRRALVRHGPTLHGYQERGADGSWGPFTTFREVPVLDWADSDLREVDLDGDGLADLLRFDGEVFCWHPSLGRKGYGDELRVVCADDEDRGPRVLNLTSTEAVLLADMSGDGLADLVRIRAAEVRYWPNLGYGRFGAPVTLALPDPLDAADAFRPERVRVADIDGSGTTDLVYLGHDRARFWLNHSGNTFGETNTIAAFRDVDNLATVDVVDLLGTGTSCLVWSSPLSRNEALRISYVDLSRGVDPWPPIDDSARSGFKPNLLSVVRNNLGAETRLLHASSTRSYVADREAGTPWATRLPFPVHVIERVETFDHVSRTRLVSTYRYRHGHFDGDEREFRGFGFVEQLDAETFPGERGAGLFADETTTELHRPPARTRTWFHTGAFLDEAVVSKQYAAEYDQSDDQASPLPDSELPAGLTAREARQARRALAGKPLRVEVYADDGLPSPYSVVEHRYQVNLVQPSRGARSPVFRTHALETVTYSYERNPADPRVRHDVTLDVDRYGNVLATAAMAYPRRSSNEPEQLRLVTLWTTQRVTNRDELGEPYRLGVPVEARTYEVTGLPPPTGGRYALDFLRGLLDGLAAEIAAGVEGREIPYEVVATQSHPQRRLVEHVRTVYWDDSLDASLALGDVGTRALVHHTERMGLTQGLRMQVYGDRVTDAALGDDGRYGFADGAWWIPSGTRVYEPTSFYLPARLVDPFGNESRVEYDLHRLLVVALRASQTPPYDVLVTRVEPDYRVLSPRWLTDANGNRSRVEFDILGRVVAAWTMGKEGSGDGDPVDLPGALFTYDAWSWANGKGPVWAHVATREVHGSADGPWQEARAWSDGSGRVVMTKMKADPGPAWTLDAAGQPMLVDTRPINAVRWVGSGRTVFDNKGSPVKQYEPYFSTACVFEDEAALVEQGVTPILHYDPLGRLVLIEHPDGSLSRVQFDPWLLRTWDANDTAMESRWYADRGKPDPAEAEPSDPDERAAWLSAQHDSTPTRSHLDVLGRAYLVVADGGAFGSFATRTDLDVEGNIRSLTDARGNVVLRQVVDVAGRVLHTNASDAGERWTLPDVAGVSVRSWDSRGFQRRTVLDALRRPLELWVLPPAGEAEFLARLTVYGETHPEALERNLRGRPQLTFDGAGLVTADRHDFKGNLVAGRQRLSRTYTATPDWTSVADLPVSDAEVGADPLLEHETFSTATEYDALNRPTRHELPDSTALIPAYNVAGLLKRTVARLRGDEHVTSFIEEIAYDARGQRERIDYANGVHTLYDHDPVTLRLKRLQTLRGDETLQDLTYTYDAVGNVVQVRDAAQQSVFFAGDVSAPGSKYAYDALYRLASATGREHASLAVDPLDSEPALAHLPHPNDSSAIRPYTETYTYDSVGNVLELAHQANGGSWIRRYRCADDSNRVLVFRMPADALDGPYSGVVTYDEHGNTTSMPHLSSISWDFADQMQSVDLLGGGNAHYTYDASGQRVRKVVQRNGGLVEERIYLGAYELHRRRLDGTPRFERETIHLMDDTQRVALIETKTVDAQSPVGLPETRVRYQLADERGSSTLEVDENAALISYEQYHPYGTTALWLATSAAEVSVKRYRYTGKEKDEETGLYYHGARHYAAWLARWISTDRAGPIDSGNAYRYCNNAPVTYVDRDGNDPVLPHDTRTIEERNASYQLDPKTEAQIRTQLAAADEQQRRKEFFAKGEHGERGTPMLPLVSRAAASYVKPETAAPNEPAGVDKLKELNANADVAALNFTRDSLAVGAGAFGGAYVVAGAAVVGAPPVITSATEFTSQLATQAATRFPSIAKLTAGLVEGLAESPGALSPQFALAFGGGSAVAARGAYALSEIAESPEAKGIVSRLFSFGGAAKVTPAMFVRAVEGIVARVSRELAENPAKAAEVLTNEQMAELASAATPAARLAIAKKLFGIAVEQLTATEVKKDPLLSAVFKSADWKEQMLKEGIGDLYGTGPLKGIRIDITTWGSMLRKIAQGKKYTFVIQPGPPKKWP